MRNFRSLSVFFSKQKLYLGRGERITLWQNVPRLRSLVHPVKANQAS